MAIFMTDMVINYLNDHKDELTGLHNFMLNCKCDLSEGISPNKCINRDCQEWVKMRDVVIPYATTLNADIQEMCEKIENDFGTGLINEEKGCLCYLCDDISPDNCLNEDCEIAYEYVCERCGTALLNVDKNKMYCDSCEEDLF